MERIEKLKAILKENPEDSFAQHALALEHIKSGQDDDAKILFQTLLARDENYVGSYYHLGKLLERMDEKEQAVVWYEKGMAIAKKINDNHAYNELQAAYEDLIY